MAESNQGDWSPYSVGKPSTKKNWIQPDCVSLTTVTHVTHMQTAVEVIRAGQLTPQLVFDKSRLNSERILVLWLSPNDWAGAGGFRYGNVAFDLDWSSVIDGKNFYWVGSMAYEPTACRILITEKDRSGELLPYEPTKGDGPWWWDKKKAKHYWNGKYCIEFMLESEIPLTDVTELRFVRHHKHRCSISTSSCPDRNLNPHPAAARFLAGLCNHRLLKDCTSVWTSDEEGPRKVLEFAWEEMRSRIVAGTIDWGGPVQGGRAESAAVARAAMGALYGLAKAERIALMNLFEDSVTAIDACAAVIEADLGLDPLTLPRETEEAADEV